MVTKMILRIQNGVNPQGQRLWERVADTLESKGRRENEFSWVEDLKPQVHRQNTENEASCFMTRDFLKVWGLEISIPGVVRGVSQRLFKNRVSIWNSMSDHSIIPPH